MALTDLNVALRLSTREFNRELGRAESALRSASDRLSGIGNTLSLAITAPLAGIGGAAIVAAGEFEKLRLGLEATMTDAGYSIAQARQELEQLREVAKAPGIDFEQAVKGSLRLQSVGLSAEQARETIAQFANGVAAAGGTADNLNSVTTQLSQIIGKGKILNEDLVILKENMPSVSRALTNAFGTATAEGLRDLNVSAEELVVTLTKELAKAPRVAGGIANSIQNARVAVVEAGAKIGDALNKAFNITGALDRFAAFVVRIADAFADLSPETQRAIFAVGAFALALGPAIRVGGALVTGLSSARLALIAFSRDFKTATSGVQSYVPVVQRAIAAFNGLSLATRLAFGGALIGIILAAGAAIATYAASTGKSTEAQKAFRAAQSETNKEIADATAKVQRNFDVLKNTQSGYTDRKKAIDELKAAFPEYLEGLDLEKTKVEDLEGVQTKLNDAIIKGIAERRRSAAVEAELSKVAEARLRLQQIEQKGFDALTGEEVARAGRSLFGTDFEKQFVSAGARAEVVRDVIQALNKDIQDANKAATEIGASFEAAFGLNTQRAASAIDDDFEAAAEKLNRLKLGAKDPITPKADAQPAIDELEKINNKLLEINEKELAFNIRFFEDVVKPGTPENLPEIVQPIKLQTDESTNLSFDNLRQGIENLKSFSQAASEETAKAAAAADEAAQKNLKNLQDFATRTGLLFETVGDTVIASIDKFSIFEQAIIGIGSAITQSLEASSNGWEVFKNAAIDAISKVIGMLIQQYVAQQIVNAAKNPLVQSLGPAAAAAIAAAAGALASVTFKKVVGAAKFADGGIVYGPTLGLVGEYPGASNNPEVIAPLSKLRSLISPADEMTLQTRISGNDLVVLVERAQKQRNRTR